MAGKRKTIPTVWRGRKYKKPAKSQRLKPGKAGSAQRMFYRSGGSQRDLAIWQTVGQQQRQNLRKAARKNPKKKGLTQIQQKRVIARRRKNKQDPMTGFKAGAAPVTGLTRPSRRIQPSRLRGFGGR